MGAGGKWARVVRTEQLYPVELRGNDRIFFPPGPPEVEVDGKGQQGDGHPADGGVGAGDGEDFFEVVADEGLAGRAAAEFPFQVGDGAVAQKMKMRSVEPRVRTCSLPVHGQRRAKKKPVRLKRTQAASKTASVSATNSL